MGYRLYKKTIPPLFFIFFFGSFRQFGKNTFLETHGVQLTLTKENRIYIRVEFTEKSVKRPFCCTFSILQVYLTYLRYITFWGLEHN